MRRIKAAAMILCLLATGCANAHQNAYIAGKSTKELVEAAYGPWDEFVNERIDDCSEKLPADAGATREQFEDCLGPAAEHDKVVKALEIYHTAALALFVVLSRKDSSDDEVKAARDELLKAARDIILLIPGANEKLEKIKALAGGL
jgi:hypothetical protein